MLIATAFAYDFWVDNECWQPIAVLATFVVSWVYFALIQLCDSISHPFAYSTANLKADADKLNPEILLLNVEANLFDVMRSGFGQLSRERFECYKDGGDEASSMRNASMRISTELEKVDSNAA